MTVSVRICSSAAEMERSLEIYNTVVPRRAYASEDAEAWRRTAVATVDLLGAVDGVVAGSAAAGTHSSRPHISRAFVTVLRQLRRRGVGSALFNAVSAWAIEQGASAIETSVESDDEESLGFALRRGFHEFSRELGFELVLAGLEPPAIDPPAGIEIVLLADRPELTASAYDVGVEALPDIPGSEDWTPPPFEEFVASHLRGLAIFVAVADREVVGYAKLRARPGGRTADHGMTAVRRSWRGQGIAKSLKLAEIAWANSNGIERLTATNEQRNAAMRQINASLGYQPTPGRVELRRSLESSLP